jgi:hypothetical protein
MAAPGHPTINFGFCQKILPQKPNPKASADKSTNKPIIFEKCSPLADEGRFLP